MVHRLELLRHAKSSWDDPGLPDHDRPLAPRGIKACARLREHARESGLAADLVLCSSATRAVQTWEGIRGGLADEPAVQIEDHLYRDDADGLLDRLQGVSESVESVLLIGHNPALEGLALGLAGDGEVEALARMSAKYLTGVLAILFFSGDWKELTWAAAHLDTFIVPRELK